MRKIRTPWLLLHTFFWAMNGNMIFQHWMQHCIRDVCVSFVSASPTIKKYCIYWPQFTNIFISATNNHLLSFVCVCVCLCSDIVCKQNGKDVADCDKIEYSRIDEQLQEGKLLTPTKTDIIEVE